MKSGNLKPPFKGVSVVGLSPFESPDVTLVQALVRAGAIGVLDLGRDAAVARDAMRELAETRKVSGFGVRLAEPILLSPGELPSAVTHVILGRLPATPAEVLEWRKANTHRELWVQVGSLAEARAALVTLNPTGLVLKGNESGGRVGGDASFILLQEAQKLECRYWVQGGIGMHTAAAAFAAGAEGVVLDSQLALFKECTAPEDVKKAAAHAEGTEVRTVHGHQVFYRPDLGLPRESEVTEAQFIARLGGRGLKEQFLPAGQDLCLAKKFAEKHTSVSALVSALKRAYLGHLKQARALEPLAPRSPMAEACGTEFPIAQGPMTRVSDRAAFADAVSTHGALPFLALSLMRKAQCRELLTESAKLLGAKPWGVGILGFVPEELQAEQLEVLADFNPTALLIAGGKPSQAAPFEARGIRTFLHVPSPGLLKQFLKDGARRFVFEGRECGGHVGPRSSFVLWETQIDLLLAHEAVHEVEVFFAGGIHDALSGAMVAALSAPLAARGAKVGVLIGTAYLFTREAVESGAILENFQKEAIACETTALLETAPGHATRCATSPFIDAFARKKEELKTARVEAQAAWAELEGMNVGRLRIASKGVERVGDTLIEVDLERQRAEGMYMIGQVAQLRDQVCTMAELHREISEGATACVRELSPATPAPTRAPDDVAIIGMACLLPGASDVKQYWKNILEGTSAVGEVPAERWNVETYYEADTMDPSKSISKWGAFLKESTFDPIEYGIPPNSMGAIEPIQLLSLKVSKQALADAGYGDGRAFDRERVSVIFGAESGTDLAGAYGFRALYPQLLGKLPKELDEFLPRLSEDSFPGVLANVIAGRVANRLDLGGSNFTVDAACASSIAALDLAVKELTSGESEMVLCGGADLHNSINDYLMFTSVHALSPTGRSRPFSADANGIVLGEGVAVVCLKRLKDAQRDGDRVYAVIKGVGSSSDGKSLGLTAPRKEGQMRALHRAYSRAGVEPSSVELVEAHGTGTVVGDRTELETLTEVFSEAGALANQASLGSVKAQIGHTKCAAGLAGLIKAALAVHHGVLPPTWNVQEPNPGYRPESSPFAFLDHPLPWTSGTRQAGVSAFGFGGTNFHTVLSSDAAPAPIMAWASELFLFDGETELRQLERAIASGVEIDFPALAASTCTRFKRNAIVARDLADIKEKITRALKGEDGKGVFLRKDGDRGKLAFLFSGQGSQYLGMGAALFAAFPHLRTWLARGSELLPLVYPKGKGSELEARLKDTRIAQPALGMIELALVELLAEFGVEPDVLAGHSYGEIAALAAAGAIRKEDLLAISQARAEAIVDASFGKVGAMAAVFAPSATVAEGLEDLAVVIANQNAPDQSVISGEKSEVERALKRFEAWGVRFREIPVSCAFHSPLLVDADKAFEEALAAFTLRTPTKPVYSNATAKVHEAGNLARALGEQILSPVRFQQQIERMHDEGVRTFLEIGPGAVLKNLVSKILEGKPHFAQSFDRTDGGLEPFVIALAELAARGVTFDPTVCFRHRAVAPLDLQKLENAKPSATAWLVNGHLAKPRSSEIPRGALRPNLAPVATLGAPITAPQGDREAVVRQYLNTVREMVEGQRQVMLQFLGGDATAQPVMRAVIAETVTVEKSVATTQAKAAPAAATPAPAAASGGDVKSVVMAVVCQKTGYPEEMLGLDQDLEADLSIDSIKRFEILAEIGERLGLTAGANDPKETKDAKAAKGKGGLEKLASLKTLRALIAALEEVVGKSAPAAAPKAAVEAVTAATVIPVNQFSVTTLEVPLGGEAHALEGKTFTLLSDSGGVALELAKLLRESGAEARVMEGGKLTDDVGDGLILLSPLDPSAPQDPIDFFIAVQSAIRQGTQWVIGARTRGVSSRAALGVSGLFKSLRKEYVSKAIKLVELEPAQPARKVAETLMAEIRAADPHAMVGYQNGVRIKHVPAPIVVASGKDQLNLNRNSVILMLGGARGIAARTALKFAQAYGCRFEIIGRTALPGAESLETADLPDLGRLRTHLIASGQFSRPAEIEAECRRILGDREIRATLKNLEGCGSRVRYHQADVRDKAKLREIIDGIYREGRIDGVIHAAGVLSDSLLLDKSEEAFLRVYDTKVNPAEVLLETLGADVKFVALFSSVSGFFGNRGQTDYAAANSALDRFAQLMGEKIKGRTVSFNWGPWAETGMVTAELENEYRRRGIGLIPPEEGSRMFLDELRYGDPERRQVVIMSGSPESFDV